jgi:archaellum component FlaC
LQDYLKAVDFLTINSEEKLKTEVKKLESHISNIKTVEFQLEVKSNEIQIMKEKYEQELKAMREEMENKFQQILTRTDVAKLG